MSNDSMELKVNSLEINMLQNNKDHETLKEMLIKIDKKIDCIAQEKVSITEFLPVKNLVYGMVSFILLAFLGTLISLTFIK